MKFFEVLVRLAAVIVFIAFAVQYAAHGRRPDLVVALAAVFVLAVLPPIQDEDE